MTDLLGFSDLGVQSAGLLSLFFFIKDLGISDYQTHCFLSICIIDVTRHLKICHVDREHAPLDQINTAIVDSIHSLLSYKIQVYHNYAVCISTQEVETSPLAVITHPISDPKGITIQHIPASSSLSGPSALAS